MMNNQKVALITGASGGIGGEIAKALSLEGYKVILQGRNQQKLAKLQQGLAGKSEVILGDLNNPDDRNNILEKVFNNGIVDLLVNAAGVSCFSAFKSMHGDQISALMQTNLVTPMIFTQEFIAYSETTNDEKSNLPSNETISQAKRGQAQVNIINVGSAFGFIGYPGFSSYCASKFGLRGFTESLAREYSDTRFRFGYFAPRATHTDINTNAVDEMNAELGNVTDSPAIVAQAFLTLLKSSNREKVVGWPEKLFVRVNGLIPKAVDSAIKSKLPIIKRFMTATH